MKNSFSFQGQWYIRSLQCNPISFLSFQMLHKFFVCFSSKRTFSMAWRTSGVAPPPPSSYAPLKLCHCIKQGSLIYIQLAAESEVVVLFLPLSAVVQIHGGWILLLTQAHRFHLTVACEAKFIRFLMCSYKFCLQRRLCCCLQCWQLLLCLHIASQICTHIQH